MQTSNLDKLGSTFLEVVEQLTFMFGEQVHKNELDTEGTLFMKAAMDFSGDLTGRLTLAVPQEVTVEIAANILGLEPEEVQPEDMRRDALAEMLNVVCGHVIMSLVGGNANFKLNSPETGPVSPDEFAAMQDDDDFLGFDLDDNPVFLGLKLES